MRMNEPEHCRVRVLRRFFLAFLLTTGALSAGTVNAAANLLRNGDFEQGAKDWTLVDSKRNPGGKIVRERDGNQILRGSHGKHFLGALSGEGLGFGAIKELAGARLTLTFRVKGDQYAHPNIALKCLKADGKQGLVWLICWSRRYPIKNIRMKPEWSVVTRDRVLPADVEKIISLDVYANGQEIFYDDIKLTAWSPRTAKAGEPDPAWLGMTFESGEEILEFANTCNSLLCEWSRLLSDLYGLRRSVHYVSDEGAEERVLELAKTVWACRDRLTALRELYVKVITDRYGKLFTAVKPWGFYAANDYAGREMMLRVMKRKSAKAPLVAFERELKSIQNDVTSTQATLFKQACERAGWTPVPAAQRTRPDGTFDSNGRPRHIIFGVRNQGWYSLFSTQWLNPEITMHVSARLDQNAERFTSNWQWNKDTLRPYGARGWARPLVVPLGAWLAPDFLAKANAEPGDYYESTEDGVALPGKRYGGCHHQFQFLNPKVMSALEDQYTAYARLCKRNEDYIACLSLVSEVCFFIPATAKPVGYSRRFKKGLQQMLAEKFGDIDTLNRAWGSDYQTFGDIALPTKTLFDAMHEKDLPLIYEYRKFRKDCYSTYIETMYAAIKRGSDVPVVVCNARDYMNGNSLDPWNSLRLVKVTDVNAHHHCTEGGPRQDAINVYHQSLARYAGGKKCGSDEYYPTNRLGLSWNWQEDPFVLYSHTIRNIWKDLASEYALLHLWWCYQHGDRRDAYRRGAYAYRSGITLLDEYHTVLSHLQERLADGCHDALFETRKVLPEVAVLAPFDATMVCWPDARIMHEGYRTHNFLAANQWEYEYVPEKLVTSGEETLTDFKVLLAPYTLWALDQSQQRLLKWVEDGGTLIAVGPYGYWDEYGRKSCKLIESCFGELPMPPARGRDCWTFRLAEEAVASSRSVTVESARNGECRLISVSHGKGKVYLTTVTSLDALPVAGKRVLNGAIMAAAGFPQAYGARRSFSLYTREHPETRERYLIAVNDDTRARVQDTVTVLGEYPRPVDVACLGGFPARARVGTGCTTLSLSLAPGEGVILHLGKYDGKRVDRAMAELAAGCGRKEREKVLRVLDGLARRGDVSYARAMCCRNVAVEMLKAGSFGPALVWGQKAAEYASKTDSPRSDQAYTCTYSRSPMAVDGKAKDWGDADWNELGASRFKTKWDERNLYVLAELKDDEVVNTASIPRLWSGDGIELYLNLLNLEGHRAMGQLDYQYCFSSSGKAQVMSLNRTRPSPSRVAVEPMDGGYRLEVAIPHSESLLAPVGGYELAFNLRHFDFRAKPDPTKRKRSRLISDTRLKDTGTALHTDTFGWPKLRLVGGRKSLRPQASYSKDERLITVSGLGCTLERVVREVNDPAVARLDQEGVLLGADIAVADFSDLALTMDVRSRNRRTGTRITAGAGASIEVRGDCDLLNVNLSPEAENGLWSLGKTQVRLMREIGVTVKDKNGRPMPKINTGLTGTSAKTKIVAFNYDSLYADEKGRATFAVPAAVVTVNDTARTRENGSYEVVVEAKEVPGQYPIAGLVEPWRKTEYTVLFEHRYHEE